MNTYTFSVLTKRVSGRGDVWHTEPASFDECLIILTKHGWKRQNAIEALRLQQEYPDKGNIIASSSCEIC